MWTWSCVHIWVCTNENMRRHPSCTHWSTVHEWDNHFMSGKMESVPWKWAVIFRFVNTFFSPLHHQNLFCFVPASVSLLFRSTVCLSVSSFLSIYFSLIFSMSFLLLHFYIISLMQLDSKSVSQSLQGVDSLMQRDFYLGRF